MPTIAVKTWVSSAGVRLHRLALASPAATSPSSAAVPNPIRVSAMPLPARYDCPAAASAAASADAAHTTAASAAWTAAAARTVGGLCIFVTPRAARYPWRVRALLIVNPRATSTTPLRRDVIARALASAVDLAVMETRYRGHAASLAATAADAGHGLVLTLGGDGTVNEAVNGIVGRGRADRGGAGLAGLPMFA